MNIKKLWMPVFALLLSSTVISAQEQRIKEEGKTEFKPHWFMQVQVGAAHTLGEAKFSDLISPAAAINVGYQFAPAWRARVGVSGWQAKGGWVSPQQDYQYKYLQGNIDIVSDLSTLFCGFNPKRVFNGYVFLGGGLNRGFDNDEANALDTRTYEMEYLWRDGKFLIAGRMGLGCNLRLNDRLSINIEGNANVLSDKFNSKKAGNADWQFNALIGLQDDQKSKIDMLVEYLQNNPAAKVKVTGYADVNTGNPKINKSLSEKRAGNVADALKAKGITTDRIMVDSKGDTVQPYKAPEENRVSICIAE